MNNLTFIVSKFSYPTYDNCIYTKDINLDGKYAYIFNKIIKLKFSNDVILGSLNFNDPQRKFFNICLGNSIIISIIDQNLILFKPISKITFTIITVKNISGTINQLNIEILKNNLIKLPIYSGLKLIMQSEINGLKFTVLLQSENIDGDIITENSIINFISINPNLNIEDEITDQIINKTLFKSNFNFKELGIGGLDNEFEIIFRRAFASRTLSPSLIKNLNLKLVKGLLLYGGPGTGKTLIARKIGEILNCEDIQIVLGPSLLNSYVGKSEENVRKLFEPAASNPKKLHLIIIDEFDALGKKRGSDKSSSIGDNMVNTLLACMDGVEEINNVIIIAMTNKKEMIDEALLRPGRFEIHVEIKVPNELGRYDILQIHTNDAKKNGFLDENVNLNYIAKITTNYSGAEIQGLVTNATSFAISKQQDPENKKYEIDEKLIKITQDDFLKAFSEIKPALGSYSEDLLIYLSQNFILYSENYNDIYQKIISEINDCKFGKNKSILITGNNFSGKTLLAANITKMIKNFACIKFINAKHLKYDNLFSMFSSCNAVESSLIILDGLEDLIGYSKLGNRYEISILQDIKLMLSHTINQNKRCVILITCSDKELVEILGIENRINHIHHIEDELYENNILYTDFFKN